MISCIEKSLSLIKSLGIEKMMIINEEKKKRDLAEQSRIRGSKY